MIHYHIETFLLHYKDFNILLSSVLFRQTYYDICFFHIPFFKSYLLQISFYIYLLQALSIFLYCFHNNLMLYLVLLLCFSDNKSCHSFFIYNKKKYNKTPILSIRLELSIMKVNSVSTTFNINNGNIIKTNRFLH